MKPKTGSNRPSTGNKSLGQSSRMSISLTSSLGPTNKYPKCEQKKQHSKQILNLICLSQNCKARGPICAMCKSSDHATHIVIPMKKFLQNVEECIKTKMQHPDEKITHTSPITMQQMIPEQKSPDEEIKQVTKVQRRQQEIQQKIQQKNQKKIQEIIELKNKMLYRLSVQITTLAEQIRKIEQKIINQCDHAVEQIRNTIIMKDNMKNIVAQLQEQENMDYGIYKKRIETLLNIVKCKSKQSYEIDLQGLAKSADKIYKLADSFVDNIQQWAVQSIKSLNNVFEHNPNSKKCIDSKQNDHKDPSNLKFSQQLKIKSIQLSNQNKTARLGEKIPGIVLATVANLKQKTIKLKIGNLSSAIMVGVGFKDIIKTNQYKFNSASIGHGAYMISHNSYIYSHHNKASNMVMKGLTFASGEEISIFIKGQSVVFTKKTDLKSVTLALKKMVDADWKQLAVCVMLGGIGDKVDIIQ